MIVFIILLVIFIALISLGIYWIVADSFYDYLGVGFMLFFTIVGLFVLVIITVEVNVTIDGTIAEQEAKAEILKKQYTYLIETQESEDYLLYQGMQDIYSDTFGGIRNYNKRVAKHQALSNNSWVGIWHPNEWNDLELINLDELE